MNIVTTSPGLPYPPGMTIQVHIISYILFLLLIHILPSLNYTSFVLIIVKPVRVVTS